MAWLFLEPVTWLEECLNMLQSYFRKMLSARSRVSPKFQPNLRFWRRATSYGANLNCRAFPTLRERGTLFLSFFAINDAERASESRRRVKRRGGKYRVAAPENFYGLYSGYGAEG